MNKILGVFFLSLVISTSAQAVTTIPWTKEGCESVKGEWITAHSPDDDGCDAAHVLRGQCIKRQGSCRCCQGYDNGGRYTEICTAG